MPESFALRFEHFVEPTGAYFPGAVDAAFAHPEFTLWIAVLSTAGRRSSASRSPTPGSGKGVGPHGITERNRLARAGYTLLVNKYYLDHLYTDVIVGGIKGPIARAAYWVNQNVIDGVVNAVGIGARRGRPSGSTTTSTRASSTARQRLRRGRRGRRARSCASIQTGQVQQYGAYLFGGGHRARRRLRRHRQVS